MKAFSQFILRRAGLIVFVGFLFTLVGGYFSVQLFKNLRTDLEELLPTTARSVIDLNEVTSRLESIDNLAILIRSDDVKASRRFVDDLARKLQAAPKDTISSVEYRIDRELKFFEDRRALYMELDDLTRVRDYIRDRLDYEKSLYNPLNIFSGINLPEPKLDFTALRMKYDKRTSSYSRFPGGYYATPDEKKRVILANMPGKSSGVGSVHKIKDFVVRAVDELDPKSYAPDLQVLYTGGVQNTIEEQAALVADLELSTVVTILLVTCAMYWFYRIFRATLALMISLLMGTLWTFGAAYFAVGYLNANSAFLGSIVIGNGINFGIILLARYVEERRKGGNNGEATRLSISHTATATWTAALAAGLSYGSLMLTSFRGFNQFGIIGLIGMVLCWISAFTMLPALLTLADRMRSLSADGRSVPKAYLTGNLARLVSHRPRLIWMTALGLTVLSFLTVFKFNSNTIIESDLAKLRNKESMEKGSGYLSKYVDEVFQRYLSPMVILPHDREHARQIADVLKKKKEAEGPKSLIASVQTLDDFVPRDQQKKIAVMHDIQKLLPERLLVRLSPSERKLVKEFITPTAMKPVREQDLPELVLSKFREKDGSIGKLVLVEPPITQETLDKNNLLRFIADLRAAADSVAPGSPLAGSLPISADMISSISNDGPKATLFAFLAVVVLVIVLFRNVKTITLILFSLAIGVIWLGGLVLGEGIKINFLNFIALPITFGIGVDYGVNIFQRYREEGSGSIIRVIRDTGGAVGLCSFTTITGYGSLLIAQNQAFVSFGLLAVLGELTCLTAALIALPAFLLLQDKRKSA